MSTQAHELMSPGQSFSCETIRYDVKVMRVNLLGSTAV